MSATNKGNGSQHIIIKRKKGRHENHAPHGGWKVAYADFVTAMMTFFLLMWLVNVTDPEQKQAMSDYFNPDGVTTPVVIVTSGIISIDQGGNRTGEDIDEREKEDPIVEEPEPQEEEEFSFAQMATVEITREEYDVLVTKSNLLEDIEDGELVPASEIPLQVEQPEVIQTTAKEQTMLEIWEDISRVLEGSPELRGLTENIKIEEIPEGLRIHMLDKEDFSMFELADTRLTDDAKALLHTINDVVGKIPHDIAITGHTDARPYSGKGDYSNWELSADRAQSARRYLVSLGFDEKRISRIEGKADSDPYIEDDPMDPRNRRISITVLRFKK